MIIKWIKEKTNKNPSKFSLIFKMTKNGTEAKEFHKCCDDKGPTLTLIETTKNKIFGGYTPLNWNKSSNDETNQTFIFSLNLIKKYDLININNYAIRSSEDRGPYFGLSDIRLNENMKGGDTYANFNSNFLSQNNLELTGGLGDHEKFETKELEVYSVIFN